MRSKTFCLLAPGNRYGPAENYRLREEVSAMPSAGGMLFDSAESVAGSSPPSANSGPAVFRPKSWIRPVKTIPLDGTGTRGQLAFVRQDLAQMSFF
jgi:hypothetical protein